ncbi:hypothetical protein HanRHA438_Chr17g0820671 [Helianthus annuus]|nr:hypothetical protein HanRHA438_Chr17g0820671 [Helianthus annuus]
MRHGCVRCATVGARTLAENGASTYHSSRCGCACCPAALVVAALMSHCGCARTLTAPIKTFLL